MRESIVVKNHPMARQVPCDRDCPDRKVGCHGSCEKYIEWRAKYNEIADGIRKIKEAEADIVAGRGDAVEKSRKIRNSRWG